MKATVVIQRTEGAAIAAGAMAAVLVFYTPWWWILLAAFLLFDVSMIGYVRSPRLGAVSYNLVHTFVWPAALAVVGVVTAASAPVVSVAIGITACAWAFHVGVDRALGYGLKLPDAFTSTHLGGIGTTREDRPNQQGSGGSGQKYDARA